MGKNGNCNCKCKNKMQNDCFKLCQVNSLFERIPRRRGGDRWSADLEELEEEVEAEEGEECWGCGAKSCVFKRARHGRLLCRPGRPRGEIIYTAGKAFRDLVEPGSTCWGCGGAHCKIGRDGRCRRVKHSNSIQHWSTKKKKKSIRRKPDAGKGRRGLGAKWMLRM